MLPMACAVTLWIFIWEQSGGEPQGQLDLSEQYGTPTLPYMNNLPFSKFNKDFWAHPSPALDGSGSAPQPPAEHGLNAGRPQNE